MNAETWSQAWRHAAREFWSTEEPSSHFTTSSGPLVAERIAEIVREVDARLGHPADFTVVDIGCGDGGLLADVRERSGDLATRARWVGVDVRPDRRSGIESVVSEAPAPLAIAPIRGVVMAHEWLDEIPCDVVERDHDGVNRLVLVDRWGIQTLGPSLEDDDACTEFGVDAAEARAWLERWWPLREPGDRAELGTTRDRAWQWMSRLVDDGAILATDYGHVRIERESRHRHGTLAAYRGGRLVKPLPDGSANLTAHVALDSCADAVPGTVLSAQRDQVVAPPLPEEPSATEVERHFEALRLRDPGRLGGVGWLRWDARR
jgi:SAM-dependent MidA family methyltransferase